MLALLAQRLPDLPVSQQRAARTALAMIVKARATTQAAANSEQQLRRRRAYAVDPHAYARDVFGYTLVPQQEQALGVVVANSHVLIPAAQAVGKSWLLGLVACWRFDCVAALPDPATGRQQGARILLPGPDHTTIFETVYSKILLHAAAAEARGWMMPGVWSEKSVNWRVHGYPEWTMEAMSPPRSAIEQQAHKAAGRHHRNQHAIIEEGIGVPEALWRSVEGMCSGEGNTIISAYNPTEPFGPTAARESKGYVVVRLSALEHPNVTTRRNEVPGAVSAGAIDRLVQGHCLDMGPYPDVMPDPGRNDFVYALPPLGARRDGPREDGNPGHVDGELHVYRPDPVAEVSILGRSASAGTASLFRADLIEASFARWRARTPPGGEPSRVGIDPARMGADETMGCPSWGESFEHLLRRYAEIRAAGEAAPRLLALLKANPSYSGMPRSFPPGDGVDTAMAIRRVWPRAALIVDDAGVGSSVVDHAGRVLGTHVTAISFGGAAPEPTLGEPWAENNRASMYLRASLCLALGLWDLPPDELLKQELLAHEIEWRTRTVPKPGGGTQRVASLLLAPKDEVKQKIGRSPDRADAFVLSGTESAVQAAVSVASSDQVMGGQLRGTYGRTAWAQRRTGLEPRRTQR